MEDTPPRPIGHVGGPGCQSGHGGLGPQALEEGGATCASVPRVTLANRASVPSRKSHLLGVPVTCRRQSSGRMLFWPPNPTLGWGTHQCPDTQTLLGLGHTQGPGDTARSGVNVTQARHRQAQGASGATQVGTDSPRLGPLQQTGSTLVRGASSPHGLGPSPRGPARVPPSAAPRGTAVLGSGTGPALPPSPHHHLCPGCLRTDPPHPTGHITNGPTL